MVDKMTILQVVVIVAAILYVLFALPEIGETQEVSMYLTVGGHVGINADQTAIWFGTVPPGGNSTRMLVLNNDESIEKKVHFEATGNVSQWVLVPDDYMLGPNDSANFTIQANVPADAEYGNYTGKLLVIFKI